MAYLAMVAGAMLFNHLFEIYVLQKYISIYDTVNNTHIFQDLHKALRLGMNFISRAKGLHSLIVLLRIWIANHDLLLQGKMLI